jgi:ABC-2 type transport system permease protein
MSAVDHRPTDRGAWRLVAARDFTVRLRDKGFFISTAITLTVLSVFILLRAFGGGSTPSFDLAITGTEPDRIDALAEQITSAADRRGVDVTIRSYDDESSAQAAVLEGRVDAVLQATGVLTGDASVPAQLTQVVQDAAVRVRLTEALAEGGATREEIDTLLSQPSIEVRTLEPQDPNRDANAGIAFIAVLLAYGQLFGYGVWVATGVIEEKASRVVEILLSAIRPRQLLAGKIAGIGLLGIVQLAGIATFAITLSLATGALELPGTAVGIALVVLAWFVMGFTFYAGLFAVSGSLVSRMEELQNALVPINLIIFVSFFISIGALENPDSTLSIVASVLPVSSALAMPVRIALGDGRADRALDRTAPRRYRGARAALSPSVRRGGTEDRLAGETPRCVAVGRRDERRPGRRLRCHRPAGPARTCVTRPRCCATEGTPPPPSTTAWGRTSSSPWRRGG